MMTIIIGKIEIELPDMYIMKRFIGACLIGPRAMSQDLLALRAGSVCRLASAWMPDIEAEKPGGD